MSLRTICFFNSCLAWGGGEKWHLDTARAIARRGFQVLLVAHPRSDLWQKAQGESLEVLGVPLGRLSFLNPLMIVRLVLLFRKYRVKTIILNLPSDLKAAGIAARLSGVEKIIYRRGSAIPIRNTILNRFLFRHVVTGIIANSEETKRTILSKNPDLFPCEKIAVIYNGIDLTEYDSRNSFPLYEKGDSIVIGTAGRLSKEKNQKFLIDVASDLLERGLQFRLLIAGKGEREHELRAYAKEKGVSDHVIFLGFVRDIKAFMLSIDIFLLSSLWEGFGYVLTEAMAASRPIVAFDNSSTPEIVSDGKTGFLTPAGAQSSFADAIVKLAVDPCMRTRFGANGRRRVEYNFSDHVTHEQIAAYICEKAVG